MTKTSSLTPTLVVLVCVVSLSTRPGFVRTGSISLLPSLHQSHEASGMQEPGIRVYVQPRRATIHFGETVTIRCKARGGSTVADMPYIRFSMLFEPDTVLPLSAAIPGVTIETEQASSNFSLVRYNVAVQKLSLGNEMYNYMQYGENKFMCKAINLNRDLQKQIFTIVKV